VLDGVPEKPLTMPDTVEKILINSETGEPTNEDDPDAIEEYFAKGAKVTEEITTEEEQVVKPEPETIPEKIREKLF
jgi:membrane carboxypeptidase/penicillin-binding protein